ncbi:hypothetical protein [Nocardia miyunensis]|uniref:hypothetical protein n=1 Tax=Nocardia miyunensis TaxID=282684 RepID=UPI00082DCC70|nr:hypothetical protein [Nocardia miyunensis]
MDSWVTSVIQGQKAVVSCGPTSSTDISGTFAEALNAANRALDYLSVTGRADCAIRDAPDDSLVWWPDPAAGGVVMRCQFVQPLAIEISATAVVHDANGNIVPSLPPKPSADDAFRFVRMARTSDDLFDAYRNMFLAFESILSDIRPRERVRLKQPRLIEWLPCVKKSRNSGNTKWETENDWFLDALDCADQLVPLSDLTPPNVTNHKKWILRRIYSAERSALMHAKRGQNYLLPHDASDKAELVESLGRLWYYVKNLIEKHFEVTGQSSHMTPYTMKLLAQEFLPQFGLVVSDYDGPALNPEGDNPIGADARVVHLHASAPRVDPNDPNLWRLLAHCDAADVVQLNAIRRFGLMLPDGSGACHAVSELVGPLILGTTVVRLEMDHGLRYISPTGPPRQFSS